MKVIQSVKEMRQVVATARADGRRIGYLVTTGGLHEGHLFLLQILQRHADFTVISNGCHNQAFGTQQAWELPNSSTASDIATMKKHGVEADVFFSVPGKELYPTGYINHTVVDVPGGPTEGLCTDKRPEFFKIITTPALKLFNIVTPDVTIFGEKDYQQYAVIKKMVRDLHLPIDVIPAPTLRYSNGLALASRNRVFNKDELNTASAMFQALNHIREAILGGRRDYVDMVEEAKDILMEAGMTPDYVDIREPESLRRVDETSTDWIVFGAAYFGSDRMVDTLRVCDELRDPTLDSLP